VINGYKEDELTLEKFHMKALSPRVLVVAAVNKYTLDWSAYIDAVPGNNHKEEYVQVANSGSKLDHAFAKILFPVLERTYCWRD
jgi:hypothetical protein